MVLAFSPVHARYLGATGVEITSSYVHVGSAYPTTGGYHYQRYYNLTYRNWCPNCGKSGVLGYEEGEYSGPAYTSPEGLFYC
ncbi:MAG: hypothetical protein Q8M92_07925, partial [Candidatus Subteraquimicrobiales bacterium]|nr:hypothetical protein [Candidatus Subteraquimicrobiales bacterium]